MFVTSMFPYTSKCNNSRLLHNNLLTMTKQNDILTMEVERTMKRMTDSGKVVEGARSGASKYGIEIRREEPMTFEGFNPMYLSPVILVAMLGILNLLAR